MRLSFKNASILLILVSFLAFFSVTAFGEDIPEGALVIEGTPIVVKRICATPCVLRKTDGSCIAQGSQVCGAGYACVPRCLIRASESTCSAYSADYCGAGAKCEIRCLQNIPDQPCRMYGSDSCSSFLGIKKASR
jgi:hypothetical protein